MKNCEFSLNVVQKHLINKSKCHWNFCFTT